MTKRKRCSIGGRGNFGFCKPLAEMLGHLILKKYWGRKIIKTKTEERNAKKK